jgi:hypothetical protein
MAVESRTRWLIGMLVVTALAAVVVRSLDTVTAPTRPARQARTAAAAAGSQDAPTAIALDALKAGRGEPTPNGRNPFQFQARASGPAITAAEPPTPRPAAAAPTIAAAPTGPPPPPPIPLKFIGIVEKADGTRIAVLSDGRRPYHGVEGQELEGQYRILKIGIEALEIAYLDGRGRQTIRLSGK